jgi:uncharacterized RDD family membrane protein YckC
MPEDREKASHKQGARYVWDPQKLAWVESTEAPSKEGAVEPSKVAEVEEVTVEEVPAGGVQAEAPAPEWVLEYKGVLIRFGGAIIDFIILLVVGFIVGAIARQFVSELPFWATLVYGLLYFVGLWSWRGQTPGMMLIGARVVRQDGSPVGLGWSALRYLLYLMPFFGPVVVLGSLVSGWFSILLPLVTLVVMALTREKRGIHDFVAGTVVINTRPKVTEPMAPESAESEEPDEDRSSTSEQS